MKHGREIYTVHGLLKFSWSDTCWERGIWKTYILDDDDIYLFLYMSVCRVCGGAIGAMVAGVTNAVTHSFVSRTVWVRLAKMQSRFALHVFTHTCTHTPGMCSRTTWSRPRPGVFEAKARDLLGQGHKILSSRSRPVHEDPHPWAFYRAMLCRERLCHVVCLSITLKFNALLPPLVRLCMKYCRPIYGIESFTYNY